MTGACLALLCGGCLSPRSDSHPEFDVTVRRWCYRAIRGTRGVRFLVGLAVSFTSSVQDVLHQSTPAEGSTFSSTRPAIGDPSE